MKREHKVKCKYEYFERLADGSKTSELRFNDRDYQTGDILIVEQLDEEYGRYPQGHYLYFTITHVLPIQTVINNFSGNYVILSLQFDCNKGDTAK